MLINNLPEKNLQDREKLLFDMIVEKKYDPINWKMIEIDNYHIFVGNDALKIDGIRINVSANLSYKITEILDLVMPTDTICDIIHRNAEEIIEPCMQPDSVKNGTMHYTSNMIRHSREIDKKIKDQTKLISTVGKSWIINNRLIGKEKLHGCNYGWHCKGAHYRGFKYDHVWQPAGLAHNTVHVDYSQTYRPIQKYAIVNNQQILLSDLYKDKIFSYEKLNFIL